ncbi:MAG: biotin/lipoyl-binding protein [Nitrospinae bacterium]|nr:biotin/lipoyl-binding protein [Nitrospinota bacterium]
MANEVPSQNGKRNVLLLALFLLLVAIGGGIYAYWRLYAQFYENTDDAYVAGVLADIQPQVAGTVVSISADNTDFVKKGQQLVKLDDVDAVIALEKAKVELIKEILRKGGV